MITQQKILQPSLIRLPAGRTGESRFFVAMKTIEKRSAHKLQNLLPRSPTRPVPQSPRLRVSIAHLLSALLVSAAILVTGCDKNQLGTVDVKGNPPQVSNAVLSPDSINIDSITPVNGSYTATTVARVSVVDPEGAGSITEVTASAIRPGSESAFSLYALRDDGVAPDAAADDGIYSGSIQFQLVRSQAGRYRIQLASLDKDGLQSRVLEIPYFVKRNNSAPRLSNISAPDTITLPSGGSLLVSMSVAAADSDGLADIQSVYFRSLTSTSPDFKFYLKDDGGTEPAAAPLFQPSGDAVAGDGLFSILVPLRDTPTVRRTNIFAFQAIDTFGDTSATLIHYLTVK